MYKSLISVFDCVNLLSVQSNSVFFFNNLHTLATEYLMNECSVAVKYITHKQRLSLSLIYTLTDIYAIDLQLKGECFVFHYSFPKGFNKINILNLSKVRLSLRWHYLLCEQIFEFLIFIRLWCRDWYRASNNLLPWNSYSSMEINNLYENKLWDIFN